MTGEQAETLLVRSVVDVANVALRIFSYCGVCSTHHLATLYSAHSRPLKKAQELVRFLRDKRMIETYQPSCTHVSVHRLARDVRKEHGLKVVKINGVLEHRLAITDIYLELGMPDDFVVECRLPFSYRGSKHILCPDIYTMGMFVEVQRSPITAERWRRKRRMYEMYFKSGAWKRDFATQPQVIIVQRENQQSGTIGRGDGYTLKVVKSIQDAIKPPHE